MPPAPVSHQALPQVRAVRLAMVAVLSLLTLMLLAYSWRVYDFSARRAQAQSQSRVALLKLQILNAFGHIDEVLLQTKTVFERAGPGIVDHSEVLGRVAPTPGRAPYRCIGIVNALGDAYLRIPEGCRLPDLQSRAMDFQTPDGYSNGLLTDVFDSPGGTELVRATRLYNPDKTFAGLTLAVLNTEYVLDALQGMSPLDGFVTIESGVLTRLQPWVVLGEATKDAAPDVNASLQFQGLAGPMPLSVRSSFSRSALMSEWLSTVVWLFMGYLLVTFGLLQGTRLLVRAINRQMLSELAAQRALVESDVQSRFIANVSHEIRTPMNGVLGATRMLSQAGLNTEQQRILALVERSGSVLLATINDLLDVGKIREGKMVLENKPMLLHETLKVCCELQAPLAEAKGLSVSFRFDLPEQLRVLGDPLRIQQITTNLLNNAIKFTPAGSVHLHVELDNCSLPAQVLMSVSDTGIGLDLSSASWLLKPFGQADASMTRRYGGTGLGLSIAHQLVGLMGGSLSVESTPGKGSTFKVRWPVECVQAPPCGPALQTPHKSQVSPLNLQVLVAEDNQINQILIEHLLQGMGCAVTLVDDGRQALDALTGAKAAAFDLVFMDCQMPEIDGFEATRRFRRHEQSAPGEPRLPIVAMTALAMPEDAQRCLDAGMDDYCSKPVDEALVFEKLLRYAKARELTAPA